MKGVRLEEQQEQWPRLEARPCDPRVRPLEAPKPGKRKSGKGGRKGRLEGHGGRGKGAAEAAEDTPESPFEPGALRRLLRRGTDPMMHQAPMLEMSLASEPGVLLWRACPKHVIARDAAGKRFQRLCMPLL